MNVIGLGTDIVNINRIKKIYTKYGNHFLDKILTESEKKIEKKKSRLKNIETIAKRFAAKEAISKAIGHGFSKGIHFKNIEIYNDKNGRPYANVNGKAKIILNKISKKHNIFLSLSDDKPWAVATALITSQ
ncbi:MAG: holo-ACP synthase [Proteobacteria bacterium]|jgi:holo-[acyl-carrier protein] synthase|uniref:Holo-[acyl-carrier-protein] synthase n=2 Tax=Candidatus Fonsibacter lacus TaxID=2576439 RepID=A0A845S9N3_9PROT|nr:holo-ACP synthase [Pseudomonadota bacterium]NCU62568.1 holo-ACP synthase [Candidatus Fonsibacter lacus]NCU70263.1 holo-ACP synthase [Candidatus Fonsibacter lacus]NDE64244.1 holo-ACP synthase [Pseudomonadota bacterium]NDF57603.1 holo-ACP synthase [Pseudomonadota bacterium]